MNWRRALWAAGGLLVLVLSLVGVASGEREMTFSAPDKFFAQLEKAAGNPGIYTLDADFDEGTLVNVNHDSPNNDQLQLDSEPTPFDFIWVAASARGTIVKIDTVTGEILGEYLSAPEGRGRNPSRTTVDGNGNVWSANREEVEGNRGSAVKIGLEENGQCVDRNDNDVIDTSSGLNNVLPWPDVTDGAGGADGIVEDAEDECILIYQRLPEARNARHVSVDAANDVWVGGYSAAIPQTFHKLDGDTGELLDSFSAAMIGCGGYGGLIDGNGVLWSASIGQGSVLRYDISSTNAACIAVPRSYGLGIDTAGFIFNAMWDQNTLAKITPGGTVLWDNVLTGGSNSRGVVVTPADNDVWVANSASNTVTRLDNNGVLKATIDLLAADPDPTHTHLEPTGVAVDGAGKVWVTNRDSDNVMRIDPDNNTVDMIVDLGDGAGPYNYSDMTGSTLIAPPNVGTWTIEHDSGITDAVWGTVSWNSLEPGDSSLTVTAASSPDGGVYGPAQPVTNGDDLSVADGRHLKVSVTFDRAITGESPVLFDLTILANRPPDCSEAVPSVAALWPPNHQFREVEIFGVTDPDGDEVTITIDGILQDEPVDTFGDGSFVPDGSGVGTSMAMVRAERAGPPWLPGDGRVYTIQFTATDVYGDSCSSEVLVGVPHDKAGAPAVDSAPPYYDSTVE